MYSNNGCLIALVRTDNRDRPAPTQCYADLSWTFFFYRRLFGI